MKKRLIAITLSLFMALALVAGCASQKEETPPKTEEADFEDELREDEWKADILGVSGTLDFTSDDKGTVTLSDGQKVDFDYKVSDISDDEKSGTITITGTGISEVDGQSVDVEFTDNGLKATYKGMSYTLTPETGTK